MRSTAKAARHIPYAARTPKAIAARLAQISINKFIASCIDFSLQLLASRKLLFQQRSGTHCGFFYDATANHIPIEKNQR